jgi:hypothetical protein
LIVGSASGGGEVKSKSLSPVIFIHPASTPS